MLTILRLRVWCALLVILGWTAAPAAQCAYPKAPRSGFALTETLDTLITFGDGARTRVDVIHPTTLPTCGWPAIVYVHGMTSSRVKVRENCRRLARRGFAVVAWDIRGQGDAERLNNGQFGFELVGAAERMDIAEVVAHVRRFHGRSVDASRIGMLGFSQGAMYCWAAAAWSGRTLPANNRGLRTFPTFQVVCPLWWAPLSGDIMVPEGKAFGGKLFTVMYDFRSRMTVDPTWFRNVERMILAEDFAGLKALFDSDPFRQELSLLPTCRVPVFTQVSWNDDWVPLHATLRALDRLPRATPRRAFLTFPGHDGPRTVKPMQFDMTVRLADRWLDRYLKDERNDVENEAPFLTGTVNQTDREFRNLSPVWNRYRFQWPPPNRVQRTFYLRTGGVLAEQMPTMAEPDDTLRHAVPAGYGMPKFIQDRGHPLTTLARLPLHSVVFDTAPMRSDFAIVGAPSTVIEALPSGGNYQLHCALYRVEPSGTETFLASGAALRRDPSAAPARLAVTMNHVDALVRKGQRLRLKLQNYTYRPAVDAPNLMVAPYFESVDVRIRHRVGSVSSLTVPLELEIKPALVTSHLDLDLARTPVDDVLYSVKAPTYPRSTPYAIVYSAAGMVPGFRYAGRHVHMNWDPLISAQFLAAANTPLFPNIVGTLGDQARALPRLSLRQLPALSPSAVGSRWIAVAVLADGATTNPVELYFR